MPDHRNCYENCALINHQVTDSFKSKGFNKKLYEGEVGTSINESELKLIRLQLGISLLLTKIGHFPMFLI